MMVTSNLNFYILALFLIHSHSKQTGQHIVLQKSYMYTILRGFHVYVHQTFIEFKPCIKHYAYIVSLGTKQ